MATDLLSELGLVGEIRELTPADALTLAVEGPASWGEVERISTRHHRIAQRLALGDKPVVVARLFGTTPSSISKLLHSPAFVELIEAYQDEAFEQDLVLQSKIADVAEEALDALRAKIETDKVKPETLAAATMDLLDRAGHSPVKKFQGIVATVTPQELKEMKERARREEGDVLFSKGEAPGSGSHLGAAGSQTGPKLVEAARSEGEREVA